MKKIINSGCAIIEKDKLLLLWRIKHNHYEFPGGKSEEGETLEETATRETKEELGCDVELIKYLGFHDFHIDGNDFRSHKYLARIIDGQKPEVMEPEKFSEIFMMPIRDYTHFSVALNVRQFCEDYLNGKLQ